MPHLEGPSNYPYPDLKQTILHIYTYICKTFSDIEAVCNTAPNYLAVNTSTYVNLSPT